MRKLAAVRPRPHRISDTGGAAMRAADSIDATAPGLRRRVRGALPREAEQLLVDVPENVLGEAHATDVRDVRVRVVAADELLRRFAVQARARAVGDLLQELDVV